MGLVPARGDRAFAMIDLAKDSLIYGVGTVVNRLLGLLMLPLFTAYLTPQDYGVLTMLVMLGLVIQPIFGLGLGAGMGPTYFADAPNQGYDVKGAAVTCTVMLLTLSGAMLTVLGHIFAEPLSLEFFGIAAYAPLIGLSLVGVAITQVSTPFVQRLQFEKQAVAFVTVNAAAAIATVGMSATLVVVASQGVRGMVVGQVFGAAVGLVGAAWVASRGLTLTIRRAACVDLLRIGLPLIPGFLFLLVVFHGNKYVLQELKGLAAVGLYGVGFNLGMASAILVGAIQTAWYPYFMSYVSCQAQAPPLFSRIFTYYTISVGGVVLMLYAVAHPVVVWLTAPEFHAAYRVIGPVATSQYFLGMFYLLLPPLYFAKEVAFVSVAQGVAAVAAVLLSLWLVPSLSGLGAALAVALASGSMVIAMAGWQWYRRDRYLQVKYEYGRIFRFLVFFAAMATLLLVPYESTPMVRVAAVLFAASTILGGCALILTEMERRAVAEAIVGLSARLRSTGDGGVRP